MTTDPGDLVLDPTCGSGTTAYVAEQWGRRWITIDTSRVALTLARARLMGAKYDYYLLKDSEAGAEKEGEITGKPPADGPFTNNIRHGFVYERAPHVTLKSIANNAEIDVIWERWQKTLEPLREKLNKALKETWEEWQVPREADEKWPDATKQLHAQWWEARRARQKEIDEFDRAQCRCRISLRSTLQGARRRARRRPLHGRESVAASGAADGRGPVFGRIAGGEGGRRGWPGQARP